MSVQTGFPRGVDEAEVGRTLLSGFGRLEGVAGPGVGQECPTYWMGAEECGSHSLLCEIAGRGTNLPHRGLCEPRWGGLDVVGPDSVEKS